MHLENSLVLAPCPMLPRKSVSPGPPGCPGAPSLALCFPRRFLSMTHRTGSRAKGWGAQPFISQMRKPRSERRDFSRVSTGNMIDLPDSFASHMLLVSFPVLAFMFLALSYLFLICIVFICVTGTNSFFASHCSSFMFPFSFLWIIALCIPWFFHFLFSLLL